MGVAPCNNLCWRVFVVVCDAFTLAYQPLKIPPLCTVLWFTADLGNEQHFFFFKPVPVAQNHSSYSGAALGLGSGKGYLEVRFTLRYSTFASAREDQTLSHFGLESSLWLE